MDGEGVEQELGGVEKLPPIGQCCSKMHLLYFRLNSHDQEFGFYSKIFTCLSMLT